MNSRTRYSIKWLFPELVFILSGPLTILLLPIYIYRIAKWPQVRLAYLAKALACSIQALFTFSSIARHPGNSANNIIEILLLSRDSIQGLLIRLSKPWTFVPVENTIYTAFSCLLIVLMISFYRRLMITEKTKVLTLAYLCIGSYLFGLYGYSKAFIAINQAAPRYTLIPIMLASQLMLTFAASIFPVTKTSKLITGILIASCISVFFSGTPRDSFARTISPSKLQSSFQNELKQAHYTGRPLSYNLQNTPGWSFKIQAQEISLACERSLVKCSFIRK